jgi:hypothetical protein
MTGGALVLGLGLLGLLAVVVVALKFGRAILAALALVSLAALALVVVWMTTGGFAIPQKSVAARATPEQAGWLGVALDLVRAVKPEAEPVTIRAQPSPVGWMCAGAMGAVALGCAVVAGVMYWQWRTGEAQSLGAFFERRWEARQRDRSGEMVKRRELANVSTQQAQLWSYPPGHIQQQQTDDLSNFNAQDWGW